MVAKESNAAAEQGQILSKAAPAALSNSGQASASKEGVVSDQSAGKQLQETMTAVPSKTEDSNAAAGKESNSASKSGQQANFDQPTGSGQSAGKQLQQTVNAVPSKTEDSNAAAGKQSEKESSPASNSGRQANSDQSVVSDQSAGKQLQQKVNAVPTNTDKSNAAAQKAPVKKR